MTETLRFGLIGKQDLKTGTGTFEVRLGDGRIITMDEIRLTDFLSALTTGSVLFVKATGVAGEDNSNLFWDDTNNRLGIGTDSPSHPLHVVGIILGTQNLVFRSATAFDGTLDHAITADRTWTLQDSSDTLLARATTDTLTNKTLLATGTGNVVTGVLDRDVSSAEVVSTATETTVYSFSVPGGTLSTNRALRLTLIGDYLNNTGSTDNFTVRVSYGGTSVFTCGGSAVTQDANRRAVFAHVLISAAGTTGSQVVGGMGVLGSINSISGSSIANAPPFLNSGAVHNAVAIDSTQAQTLTISFQHGTADANISARALAVHLEVLP